MRLGIDLCNGRDHWWTSFAVIKDEIEAAQTACQIECKKMLLLIFLLLFHSSSSRLPNRNPNPDLNKLKVSN